MLAGMKKSELLAKMMDADSNLVALFESMTDGQISTSGIYGGLSPKDVLAHIAAWQQLENNWLRDSISGRGTVRYMPGFEVNSGMSDQEYGAVMDSLNAYVFEENKDRPYFEVIEDYRRTYRELVATVQNMPEEDLNEPGRFKWWGDEPVWTSVASNSYEHVEEHVGLIQRWLERQGE
jgi:hypothetical protein